MSEDVDRERERIADQLDAAIEQIRWESLAQGIDMVETLRDELREAGEEVEE